MTRTDGSDNVALAVATILVVCLALSLGDAIIKSVAASFAMAQIFVLRSVLVLPVLLVIGALRGQQVLTLDPYALLRSLCLTVMWVAYYAALPHLPLAVAAAAYYTLPLFITLFSAALGLERIGARGWIAVAMGFAGVLVVLRPGAAAIDPWTLVPLLSAMLYAAAMIITRTRLRHAAPVALAVNLNATFVVAGLAATALNLAGVTAADNFMLAPWTVMGPREWGAIAILAAVMIGSSVGTAFAYQTGPASVLGTFDFSYVAYAVLWGILFFGDVPDAVTFLGIATIVAAGILAVRRPRGSAETAACPE
ncbi:DMT family transporter [Acuticoccus sediminis]|uniref:DMT family transporter n=1 Tax=Acuticoccus sediminis TaxID=2184697 RepID=UPI001FD1C152|nr:DMT family transporter [Acuticoccus sediminis]